MSERIFYKYCLYNQFSLELLINQEAWYAKPASFNDPFDGEFEISEDITVDDLLQSVGMDSINDRYDDYKSLLTHLDGNLRKEEREKEIARARGFVEVYKNIGVLCLSRKKDSILMWSHYAGDHKGFNIEFEVPADIPVLPVIYEETLTPRHIRDIYARSSAGFIHIAYSKHIDWKYEEEWRLSVHRGDRIGPLPGKIRGINFGLRMPDQHKKTLYNIVSKISPDIVCKSAVRTGNLLSLSFTGYEPGT